MADETILILSNPETGQLLEQATLMPAGYQVTIVCEAEAANSFLKSHPPDLLLLSDQVKGVDCFKLAQSWLEQRPGLPVILLAENPTETQAIQAMRAGFSDYLTPPLRVNEVLVSVRRALKRSKQLEQWAKQYSLRSTRSLEKRVNGLEALQRVGQKVTSLLDLGSILTAVVDAAVELTQSEEGSLLLIDENTGELYMRASRNFHEDFVHTFRLPTQDTLAGEVIQTGKPLLIAENTPQKIKTSYLVHSLVYVPLSAHGQVMGVLEVDNRHSRVAFNEHHVTILSTLADYAAIAIENARLYSKTEVERNKLETVLTKIDEGVIVVDTDGRLMLVNRQARQDFDIEVENITGKRLRDIIAHPDLLEIMGEENVTGPFHSEILLDEGRVLNAQLTPIQDVGVALTMQDITHLKELDRIKSDFVNTVSHDLRSPLTAILGYVELIERVGHINDQQREFIRRVQISVHNITALINDLLDLGRIEAGFDARNEIVPISAIIQYAVDGVRSRVVEKSQTLHVEIDKNLPEVLGNPIRLRQMLNNLINNAIKYTPEKGMIYVRARAEGEQVILQISDNGPGIPPFDQPYIFDKFYRASNVPGDTPGTGLGLAIVKSIVENHHGRIWVDSLLHQGSTFTVVLPIVDRDL